MTFDSAGNICIVGNTTSNSTNLGAILVLEYSPDKPQLWKALFDASVKVTATGIAAGTNGDVYVIGYNVDGNNGNAYLTIKYDSAGNQSWFRYWNSSSNRSDIPAAVAANKDGVCVTGTSTVTAGTIDSTADMATVKYDVDGNLKWAKTYNGSFNGADVANGIALDDKGNAYVTGQSDVAAGDSDVVTIKYGGNDGQPLWIGRDAIAGTTDVGQEVIVDKNGNALVAGTAGSGSGSDDALAVEFSPYAPLDLSVGGDGKLRLLTGRADGQAARLLLVDDATGQIPTGASLLTPKDVTPQALATSPADNTTYLLGQRSDGQAQIWRYSADLSTILATAAFGPVGKQRPFDLTVGRDGKVRLAWKGTDASNRYTLYLWVLSADLSTVEQQGGSFTPPGGNQPVALSIGQDNRSRYFWGTFQSLATTANWLWTLDSTGTSLISAYKWGPNANLAATDVAVGGDSKARLLWHDVNTGGAQVWRLDTTGGVREQQFTYDPILPGAQATKIATGLFSRPQWLLWLLSDGRPTLRSYDPSSGGWIAQYTYYTF
jgi:hypothetical protein